MPSKSSKSQPKTTVKSTFQLKSNAKKSVPRPALGVIRNRQIVLSDEEDEEDQDDSQSEDEEDELEPEGDRDEDDDKEDVEEENVSVGKKRSRRALKKINETGKGRKKRRLPQEWQDRTHATTVAQFTTIGRSLYRLYGLFLEIKPMIQCGLEHYKIFKFGRLAVPEHMYPVYVATYKHIGKTFDGFKTTMLEAEWSDIKEICSFLVDCANDARSADIKKLKDNAANLIVANPETDQLSRPLIAKLKTNWGFSHPDTGRMIVPRRYIYDYLNDTTNFLEMIENGDITITGHDFPNFLYDESVADAVTTSDPDGLNLEAGLLTSYTMLRAFRAIFFSNPFSDTTGVSNDNVASLIKLKSVHSTPICYTAILLRFVFGSMAKWGTKDGVYSDFDFYVTLFEAFDDEDDEVAKGILERYNTEFFPADSDTRSGKKKTTATRQPASDSGKVRNREAREERRRKREEAAQKAEGDGVNRD